jgi:hypothetical protein
MGDIPEPSYPLSNPRRNSADCDHQVNEASKMSKNVKKMSKNVESCLSKFSGIGGSSGPVTSSTPSRFVLIYILKQACCVALCRMIPCDKATFDPIFTPIFSMALNSTCLPTKSYGARALFSLCGSHSQNSFNKSHSFIESLKILDHIFLKTCPA